MSDEPVRTTDVVDITDCFEAVNAFRVSRNLFFLAAVTGLILSQAAFWTVDLGWVRPDHNPKDALQASVSPSGLPGTIEPAPGPESQQDKSGVLGIHFEHIVRMIQVTNAVLLLAALLYWLTQVFTLLISIVGRLGGINHISRAFFLSLVVLTLVIPWQHLGESFLLGATFTGQELARAMAARTSDLLASTAYYLRFSGYPLAVLVVLILAQRRSTRWAKAILRRMEII